MPQCSILVCKNRSKTQNRLLGGITYHRFPREPFVKEKWIEATGRLNWFPSKASTICSDHFLEEDFIVKKSGVWVNFFTAAGIPPDVAATYALTFTENRIKNDMLLDLDKQCLRELGITKLGDIIAILRHAKMVHETTARDRVLSSTAAKVPVAAVTGRSTVTQPPSPASRMLEHYTRNAPTPDTSPVRAAPLPKRRSNEMAADELSIKKARLIRFGAPPTGNAAPPKEAPTNKTVFARLGSSEPAPPKALTVQKPASAAAPKQVFARLGAKDGVKNDPIPIDNDALSYKGILKSVSIAKKTFTVTTNSNNVRKIAVGTMRADEAPVSIKEKLAVTKPVPIRQNLDTAKTMQKSVKFSNHIEYKEIESIAKPKFINVFNKPERRLSMPEASSSVKARLGLKNDSIGNTNKFTVTRGVFNRLGV